MTTTQVEQGLHLGVPAELWERVTGIPTAWLAAHPVLAAWWVRVRAVGLWLSLLWVLALLVLVPDVRGSVGAYAGSFVLLVVWFVLVRTKTVSWRTTARVFSACVVWSAVIGWFTLRVADQIDLWPSSDGSGIALAGFLEESGKLVPLLVLVVVAPGRVRRFAAGDWAVLGFTSGVAFNAFEDAMRQIAAHRSLWGLLGDSARHYSLNPWTSGGFVSPDGVAVSFGHHIWTATAAMGIGLGITWWRSGWRGARVGALAFPALVILLVIAEHVSFNAHNGNTRWPGQGGEGFSPILAGLWAATGHGRAVGVLSVVLLVACLAVDVHRRHSAALQSPALDGVRVRPAGAVTETEPGLRAVALWLERVAPPAGPTTTPGPRAARVGWRVAAGTGALIIRAVAQWSGDVAVVLASHARTGGESRRDAVRQGQAVAVKVRGVRVEAMAVTTPGLEPSARRAFARAERSSGCLRWSGAWCGASTWPPPSAPPWGWRATAHTWPGCSTPSGAGGAA